MCFSKLNGHRVSGLGKKMMIISKMIDLFASNIFIEIFIYTFRINPYLFSQSICFNLMMPLPCIKLYQVLDETIVWYTHITYDEFSHKNQKYP